MAMDIIYPVRPGDRNDELRYSLRSVCANVPDVRRVWVVGYKPAWLTGVEYSPANDGNERQNVYNNIKMACENSRATDTVAIFNDDFYVTERVALQDIPTRHRMTLGEHLDLPRVRNRTNSRWSRSLKYTQIVLNAHGFEEPLSYELHQPMKVDRGAMADLLNRFRLVTPGNPPQWRTLYGNMFGIGGERQRDVKSRQGPLKFPFHSTADASFENAHTALKDMFPRRCEFERG